MLPVTSWRPDSICSKVNYLNSFVFVRDREGSRVMRNRLLSELRRSRGLEERGGGNLKAPALHQNALAQLLSAALRKFSSRACAPPDFARMSAFKFERKMPFTCIAFGKNNLQCSRAHRDICNSQHSYRSVPTVYRTQLNTQPF